MTKKVLKGKCNKPLHIFALGGEAIGQLTSGASNVLTNSLNMAQLNDSSVLEDQIKRNQNSLVGSTSNDSLMQQWSGATNMAHVTSSQLGGKSGGQIGVGA